jgi:hypothetical protein
MRKALYIAAVLIACGLTISFGKANTANTTSTWPLIVVKGKFLNQTAAIPQTNIYLPVDNGLYRLSVYATITTPSSADTSYWQFNPEWTDDSGQTYNGGGNAFLFSPNNDASGAFMWMGQGNYGGTLVLEAKGGTPISISTTLNGPPDNSAYSLYYTLERLE